MDQPGRYPRPVPLSIPLADNELLIFRHGQSTWNAERRWQGQANPPLSPHGRDEAAEAAHILHRRGFLSSPIFSSDLDRAAETARALAEVVSGEVHLDERLRERHAGEWQGFTHEEIEARWPGWLGDRMRPEGFESDDSIRARVFAALSEIHASGTRVVVSHGGVMRLIARSYGDENLIPRNLDGIRIVWPPEDGATIQLVRTLTHADIGMEVGKPQAPAGDAADTDRV